MLLGGADCNKKSTPNGSEGETEGPSTRGEWIIPGLAWMGVTEYRRSGCTDKEGVVIRRGSFFLRAWLCRVDTGGGSCRNSGVGVLQVGLETTWKHSVVLNSIRVKQFLRISYPNPQTLNPTF